MEASREEMVQTVQVSWANALELPSDESPPDGGETSRF